MIQVQASGDALGQNTKGHRGLLLSGLPHHSPAVARDLLLFFCGDNLDFVCSEAEKFEAVCNRGTNVTAVFSDPTGEDEKVHPTEQSRVCTDYLAYRNGEHIQRKRGVWIVGAGAIFKRLHIAFAGGEGEEAALMIDEIFHLVGAELLRAKKINKDPGVEISGPRAHRDSTGRGEAHGGVDRHPIAKSAETCSIAEMREDGPLGKLRAEVMNERLVRETMETVASNTRVEVALRERQMRRDFRHGLVKYIVKTGELRRRREKRLRGSDKRQSLRDVQRREVYGGAKFVQNLRRDGLVREEMGSSMHDAMAYCHWRGVNMLPNCLSDRGEGIALRLEDTFTLHERFPRGRADVQRAVAMSDAIGASGQQSLFVARPPVIHAELQRRRAAIQHEDQIVFSG